MNTIRVEHKQALMVAHRGVSGLEKENSLPAFVAAGNRSYFGIETDVHRTADGKYVVIHDSDTARVAGDSLIIENTSFDLIRSVRLNDVTGDGKRGDLVIPTLAEYIGICKKYEKNAVLELKSPFTKEENAEIVEIIRALDYLEHVTFISFHKEALENLRAVLPDCVCQFLISDYPDDLLSYLKEQHFDLDIYYKALTAERMAELHANGIIVNCWTVNDAETADTLISWGIDMITSNILE